MKDLSSVIRKAQTAAEKAQSLLVAQRVARKLRGRLAEGPTEYAYIVYFSDSAQLTYQLTPWVKPLERLNEAGAHVAFVVKNPLVAEAIAGQTTLPILLTRSMEEIESFVKEHQVRGVFYVNNSQANFTALRMTEPIHVHLSHGESEKSSMVSNQLKAYDYAFIAGNAAEQRILSGVKRIDSSHLIKIGRPQLDVPEISSEHNEKSKKLTVLYAPTWEGDSQSMNYSSLTSVGIRLVRELLADERFTLVFRPHPKSGSWSREAAISLKRITDLVTAASSGDAARGHRVDKTEDAILSILNSDVVVADVSAMTMDAIGLSKRLLVFTSSAGEFTTPATVSDRSLTSVVPTVSLSYEGSFSDLILGISKNQISVEQEEFRTHVFGDAQLGSGTARFIAASKQLASGA